MERPIIYQILVRLFGNKKRPKKAWGNLSENGVGRMNDIDDLAMKEIKKMGFNHVWYTGLIEHATCTDNQKYDIPADHPSVVKGVAGSPYAIKDYYDIAPDLASDVSNRMKEFESLVKRTHKHGLKIIIDFVPNHLARQYLSDSAPIGVDNFGSKDDTTIHFSPDNNFYYIPGERLNVPHSENNQLKITSEYTEIPAKASGNDVFSAHPSINDWYETVKLNYGVDYLDNRTNHFDPIPDTWFKMRDILLFWVNKGVDGFRCDMAEMVPVAFWHWVINEVKSHKKKIVFIAEVYQPDLYKKYIYEGGFDFLYDKVELYDTLKAIIRGHSSADLIPHVWQGQEGIGDHMLRFLENHDEQRISSPFFAGDPLPGIPMMAATAFMHKGPVMIYFGQEVGEPASGASGFSGDDGRTTIFDYWNVPEHQKWMNGGRFDGGLLSSAQKELRQAYIRILKTCNENHLFQNGAFYDLQYFNRSQSHTGYSEKVYAFVRHDDKKGVMVVINFSDVAEKARIKVPQDLFNKMNMRLADHILFNGNPIKASDISDQSSDTTLDTQLDQNTYQLFDIRQSE